MNVDGYLSRIGYTAGREPTPKTLVDLHRTHLTAIPYENLDIHLGGYLGLDLPGIFDKIVLQRRGGWCFEMNGLFAWVLRELGFHVTLLSSAVNREALGERAEHNHLILLVQLERPYLVDVGFGNGFLYPLPLTAGHYQQGYLSYTLSDMGTHWHFTNHAYGGPGYDFTLQPQQLTDFTDKCHELQTSPESGFVRVTVAHRFTDAGIISLRGAVLRTVTEAGVHDETLVDETSYRRVLEQQFDLRLSEGEISRLWQIVWRKHQEFVQQNAT
jgi:N-hydroxyarylamine O-acetyltransferase